MKENAFDFNSSTYWTASVENKGTDHLTICFAFGSIKLESFEILASQKQCRPGNFNVSVSMDGRNFVNNKQFQANMAMGENKVFNYKSNYIKCFRYIPITKNSECTALLHDIVQMEFFGYFKWFNNWVCSCNELKAFTCHYTILALFLTLIID